MILVGFAVLATWVSQASGECNSESGAWIECMDFDGSGAPAEWPECGGASWQGWTPKGYDCGGDGILNGGNSSLDTLRYYSAPRSLKVVRDAGTHDVTDVSFSFPEQKKVHIRMYVYFDSNFANAHDPSYEEEYIHFFFFNTARAGVNFGVDIINYTDAEGGVWPPVCLGANDEIHFGFHSYNNDYQDPGGTCTDKEVVWGPTDASDCWNIKAHLNEWYCVEWMWDLEGHQVKFWVDGSLKITRDMYECLHSSISTVIISGWNSRNYGDEATFWVDNIVISSDYIGPLGSSDVPPGIPGNLRVSGR
jgi:hypothetical protein